MVERHKPTNGARAATHSASADDYEKLAQHVISAIVNKRRDVVLKLPYFVTFEGDFPKGILIKKDSEYNWYKAKSFKVADYLHSRGYLVEDAKGIVKSMRTVSNLVGEIERMIVSPEQEFIKNSKNVLDSGNENL